MHDGRRAYVAAALSLMLSGCSSSPMKTPLVCAEAPTPEKVELSSLDWVPVSYEGEVLMALNGAGIDALQINLLSLRRYISQSKAEVAYYKECINKDES